MPHPRPTEAYTASEDQLSHWPEVSGNEINGVGEQAFRPPAPILWHDPEMLAHGDVQNWFWQQGAGEPELLALRTRRQAVIDQEPGPLAPQQQQIDPAEAARHVHALARESGADLVGITRIDPDWVFDGYTVEHEWLVVLGVAMDHDRILTAPELPSAVEVVDKYIQGWVVAHPVADWIRAQGWSAEAKGGPMAGPITLIPPALKAGFGELGKHGSIINRELGSSFRLSAVFTDLPMIEDQPVDIGAEDFCANCQVCARACPPDAIGHDKQTVRGEHKWYVDFDQCFSYFAETHGCGICVAVCPWSKPGRGPLMSNKMLARRDR